MNLTREQCLQHRLDTALDERTARGASCWEWRGSVTAMGYGEVSRYPNGRRARFLAHRAAYALTYGEVPDGMLVCHRCDNRRCVRPDHLFLGTHADNSRDMAAKGRQIFQSQPERAARGERHGRRLHPERTARGSRQGAAKLDEAKVADILARVARGEMQSDVARYYAVRPTTVWQIVHRRSWRHVSE